MQVTERVMRASTSADDSFVNVACRCPGEIARTPRKGIDVFPYKSEDWPRVFEQYLNASHLDAVMALHEPDARFVARSGETLVAVTRFAKAQRFNRFSLG